MIYEDKPSLISNLINVLIIFLCLAGNLSCKKSDLPPIGQELSDIDRISIVRIRSSGGRSSNSGSGINEAHLEATGIDLISCIGRVSNNFYPIIIKTELPSGQYRVYASTDQGGREELTKKLCRALSEAFQCNVTKKLIEIDVKVITCPDEDKLKLIKESTLKSEGFYNHNELPGNKYSTEFQATLQNLAWFAGYMSRNTAAQNDIENRYSLLRQAFVDETGIEGVFSGEIEWRSMDPEVIEASLINLGFELTTQKRTIPAIVIESKDPDVEWTYLNDVDINSYDPNIVID